VPRPPRLSGPTNPSEVRLEEARWVPRLSRHPAHDPPPAFAPPARAAPAPPHLRHHRRDSGLILLIFAFGIYREFIGKGEEPVATVRRHRHLRAHHGQGHGLLPQPVCAPIERRPSKLSPKNQPGAEADEAKKEVARRGYPASAAGLVHAAVGRQRGTGRRWWTARCCARTPPVAALRSARPTGTVPW